MGLRCWPGALCEIVSAAPSTAQHIGKRIVVTYNEIFRGEMAWAYVTFDGLPLRTLRGSRIACCEDDCLKPINPDTGEAWTKDERDLSLELLELAANAIRGYERV